MRSFLICILLLSCPKSVQADLIFSISQHTPGDIVKGNQAVFNILGRANVGTQTFGGFDFDIALSNSVGLGGTFVAGTSNSVQGATITGGFFPGSFPNTFATFSNSVQSGLVTLNTSEIVLATVTLDTSALAVVPGTYSIGLSVTEALDSGSNSIPRSSMSPLNYTITTAVPEPSSLASLSLVAAVGCAIRRFKLRRKRRLGCLNTLAT